MSDIAEISRRVDAALSEVGWAGAVDSGGFVIKRNVPPLPLYRAWALATGHPHSFDEWVTYCLTETNGGTWVRYFRSHSVAIEGKP